MDNNAAQKLGRLEGVMEVVQKSIERTEGKVDKLSTSHNELLTLFHERATQRNKWKDPAIAMVSGSGASLLMGWLISIWKH